jgi:signal transduction histidine kinase
MSSIEIARMPAEHSAFPRTLSLAVHELRTPVTVVSGYLRMLLREQGGPINEKQRKMLEEAERSCARISALVTEMSELGKLESGDLAVARQPFDFAALVAELASGMHEGRDRGVTLELRGAERPLEVVADRARIGAAVTALLHASLRERGDAGIVVAQCGRSDIGGAWALLAIGDDGDLAALVDAPGMADFDEWRGGLGLALPVARRVVAAHGGTIWSASGERPRAAAAMRIPLNTR